MAVLLACNQRLNHINDLLLLMAWKLAYFLENLLCLADRPAFVSGLGFQSEKLIGGNLQRFGELGNIFRAERHRAAFPTGVSLLSDADHLGKLGL